MTVRNTLLGLLSQRPRHGYDLHAAFEALAGGPESWSVKPAQVYTTLARLEEAGLIAQREVAQAGGPEKVVYAITEQGEATLAEWLLSPVESEHQRDEFFLKLMLSIATGAADPYRVLAMQRASLYRELHAVTARRRAADPKVALAHILLLERVALHIEGDLRWLEMLEARLDEIRRQPLPEPPARPRGRPPRS